MNILDYLFICHKLPERSFFYKGKQFPVCARCTGILIGYVLALFGVFFIKIPLVYCLTLMIPIGIDGTGQYMGKWISNNRRRLITGVLAGVSTIYIAFFIGKLGFYHGYNFMHFIKNMQLIKK